MDLILLKATLILTVVVFRMNRNSLEVIRDRSLMLSNKMWNILNNNLRSNKIEVAFL